MARLLVPEVELPDGVRVALAALRQVEDDLAVSRENVASAEAGVVEAQALDRRALADARGRGEDVTPAREHRDRAEGDLARAREVLSADELRFDEARERLIGAMLDAEPEWQEKVAKARRRVERETAKT